MNIARAGAGKKTTMACGVVLLLSLTLQPALRAQVTVLASGLNSPGNIIVDDTNVYWLEEPSAGVAGPPLRIGSISKTSDGHAAINYNYTGDPVYGQSDFFQDNGFLYYPGKSFDGTFYYPSICKVPRAGGSSSIISPHAINGSGLGLGPAGGVVYYGSIDQAPNDRDDSFSTVVSLSTLGGSESILTYSGYGWGAGGSYTINGVTWYYGLAALQHDKAVNDNFSYCFSKGTVSLSTDSTNLYWSDGSNIWRMPLTGGTVSAVFSGTGQSIGAIATPTTGAAAGSIFWVQTTGGMTSLMRRDALGQITTLLAPSSNMFLFNRCFAVSGDKVFCGYTGGLVEVSINGGAVAVLAAADFPFGPVSVATDDAYIYWSGNGKIMRLARPTSTPTVLGNISTRLNVGTGNNALIGGFIVTGTQPKKVIVRGIGPSLAQFFSGSLADPVLELHDGSGQLLESNDNWGDSANKQAIIDSTIPPSNSLESAIVRTLPANGAGYTAILRGASNGTGIGVVEAYDLDSTVDSKLANISTRGLVQTGDDVLIAGTIVVGQTSQKVIIRAIGPSLSVPGKLADPALELRDSNGVLLEANDNWMDSPNKQAIIDSTIPPSNPLESAIVRTLPANGASFTAIVRGVNGSTGIAVVEVYALN